MENKLLYLLKKEKRKIRKAKHKMFLPFAFIYSIFGGYFSIYLCPDINIVVRYILAFIIFLIVFSLSFYMIVYIEK